MAGTEIAISIIAIDSASNILGGIAGAIGNIAAVAIDAAKAVAGLAIDGLKFAVGEAMESESAIANLEATLKSTKGAAGLTSQELQNMATQLQGVTRFSDETIINGQAMLLTFTSIGKDIFPQATQAMLNLAQKMGSDASSAAIQLGKALNDPIGGVTALRRVGVQFTDDQEAMIKSLVESGDLLGAQTLILKELETEFGGLAVAMGETTQGKMEIFKNQISDIGETIGYSLLPEMGKVMDKLIEWLPLIQGWGQQIADFFNGEWFAVNVTGRITKLIDDIGVGLSSGNWGPLKEDLKKLWDEMILPLWDKIQEWTAVAREKLDTFVAGIFSTIEAKVDEWAAGDGPKILSDKITAWIDKSGMPEMMKFKMADAAKGMLNSLVNAVGNIDWNAVDDSITKAIKDFDWSAAGAAVGQAIEDFFTTGWDHKTVESTGTQIGSALWSGIKKFFAAAVGWDDWKGLFDKLKQVASFGFDDIGKAIVNGIIAGVKQAWQNLKNIFKIGFDDVIRYILGILGIASPSRIFADIGKELVLGLIAGWSTTFKLFGNLLTGDLSGIINTLRGSGLNVGVAGDASALNGIAGGRAMGGTLAGGTSTKAVNNYYYGPVYFGAAGEPGAYYDCPSPSPLITATAKSGGGGGGGRVR